MLHKATVRNPQNKTTQLSIDACESLPDSVKLCPGTIATLAALHGQNKGSSDQKASELLASLGGGAPTKLAVAQAHMQKGQYENAVKLLQSVVNEEDDATSSMDAMALLVKALSYADPTAAEEYVERLQAAMVAPGESGELDGEALESMEIPRFAKKAMDSSASGGSGDKGGSSSKVRKLISATGGKGRSNLG